MVVTSYRRETEGSMLNHTSTLFPRFLFWAILACWFAPHAKPQGFGVFPPSSGATSCTAPGANWLTCTISGSTLTLGAASGHGSHQGIGTCGSATTFAPCPLVAGDLPSIPLATGVTGTLPAANLPTPTASTLGGIESIPSPSHN